jgi:ELWxxDGT repeat protein
MNLAAADGTLFFSAADDIHARELWRSDGTADGTVMVADLASGFYSADPSSVTLAGSRLFLAANDVVHGRELWAGRASVLAGRPDLALQDLSDEVRALGLPSGIERGLLAKLAAAGNALSRRNGRSAAVHLLDAFVDQVGASSAGQISGPARASLLALAQDIITLLGEGGGNTVQ